MNQAEDAVLKHLESFKFNTKLSVTLLLEEDIDITNDIDISRTQEQLTQERTNIVETNKIPSISCTNTTNNNDVDNINISGNLDRNNYINVINIEKSLDNIKENLLHIINMQKFIQTHVCGLNDLHMAETWFEQYKYHYFEICHDSVVASILHRENDKKFIKTHLNEILSKVHYSGTTYNNVHELFLEMIKWVKIKELSNKTVTENLMPTEVLHDTKVQPETQIRQTRRPKMKWTPTRKNKDANLSPQVQRINRTDDPLYQMKYMACYNQYQNSIDNSTSLPRIYNPPHFNYVVHDGNNPAPKENSENTFSPVINYVTSTNPDVPLITPGTCCVCNADTNKKCIGCYQNYYCSTQCQKQHWPVHKFFCIRQTSAVH